MKIITHYYDDVKHDTINCVPLFPVLNLWCEFEAHLTTKSFRSRDQSVRSRCSSHYAAQSHVAYSVQCLISLSKFFFFFFSFSARSFADDNLRMPEPIVFKFLSVINHGMGRYLLFFSRIQILFKGWGFPHPHSYIEWQQRVILWGPYYITTHVFVIIITLFVSVYEMLQI